MNTMTYMKATKKPAMAKKPATKTKAKVAKAYGKKAVKSKKGA